MILKNTSIYILTSIISSGISFVMIPIYTFKLEPSDYGLYGFAMVLVSILYMFISGNLFILFEKDYYDKTIDRENYIFNLIFYFFTIYIISLFIIFLLQNMFLSFFNILELKSWLYIIVTLAFFQTIVNMFILIFRLNNLAFNYLYANISISIINAILGYIFIFMYDLKWDGLILSAFISNSIVLIYFIIKNFIVFKQLIKKDILKKYTKFVIEYFPTTLNWRVISYSDRFFITKMTNLSSLGLYTLGFQLSNVLNILINGFNNAWSPYFMENMHKKEYQNIINKLKIYLLFLVTIFMLIYFIAPFVIKLLFNEKYIDAIDYFNYFIFIVLLSAFHAIFSNFLVFFEKAKNISIATTFGMITNLILNYFLIKENGALGAVQATLVSYIVIILLELYFIKKDIINKGYLNV